SPSPTSARPRRRRSTAHSAAPRSTLRRQLLGRLGQRSAPAPVTALSRSWRPGRQVWMVDLLGSGGVRRLIVESVANPTGGAVAAIITTLAELELELGPMGVRSTVFR